MIPRKTFATQGLALGAAALLAAAVAAPGPAVAMVDGPEVSWRFSTWGKARAFTRGAEYMAEQLEKQTGGKFKMKVYYGEALSKAKENLDGLKINAFDAAHFCNFYHPGKNQSFMVFALPFLPLGEWKVSTRVRNELYEHPALEADMKQWNAIAYASTVLPQYEFLGKGKPPTSLDDWKGMRVRAGGGVGDAMEVLGAVRSTVTATEVYTAIERGTLDAASLPFTYAHVSYKIPEVTDWYTSNLSPGTSDCPIVLNRTSYQKLPPQYRKLLDDMREKVTDVHVEAYEAADAKNLPMLEKKLEKITYSADQLREFQRVAGKPVWDKWIAENKDKFDAKGVLDRLFALAAEAKKE